MLVKGPGQVNYPLCKIEEGTRSTIAYHVHRVTHAKKQASKTQVAGQAERDTNKLQHAKKMCLAHLCCDVTNQSVPNTNVTSIDSHSRLKQAIALNLSHPQYGYSSTDLLYKALHYNKIMYAKQFEYSKAVYKCWLLLRHQLSYCCSL